MRLYASKERWRKESADDTSEDPWLLQLRSLSSADSSDFLSRLESLASVPENKAEEHAQRLLTLPRAHQLGSKAYGNINGIRTTVALVAVAKSLWLTCPSYHQPMLCADLTCCVEIVEERYENNNLRTSKQNPWNRSSGRSNSRALRPSPLATLHADRLCTTRCRTEPPKVSSWSLPKTRSARPWCKHSVASRPKRA